MQRAGLIRYSRGHIEVLDRPGLEQAVCECYTVVKLEFDRLLTDIPRGDPSQILGESDRRALVDRPDKIKANNSRNRNK